MVPMQRAGPLIAAASDWGDEFMAARFGALLGTLTLTVLTTFTAADGAAAESVGNTAPTTAPRGSDFAATSTRWRNTTYTVPCGGFSARPVTATVRSGEGTAPGDRNWPSGYQLWVWTTTTGDLTGDGRPETAVLTLCMPQGANYSMPDVLVFTRGNKPLGRLPVLPRAERTLAPEYDARVFTLANRQLVTRVGFYGLEDCHVCGPSKHVTLAWSWDGQHFVTRTPIAVPRR